MGISIPRIFVEIENSKIQEFIESGRAKKRMLIVKDSGEIKLIEIGDQFKNIDGKIYVQEIYDDAYKWLIDLENGIIMRNSIIITPNGEYIFLKKGKRVYLFEAMGRIVVPLVKVGEKILSGRRIAAIFTGKREVRYLRSDSAGKIVYIAQIEIKPQRYLIVLIPRED